MRVVYLKSLPTTKIPDLTSLPVVEGSIEPPVVCAPRVVRTFSEYVDAAVMQTPDAILIAESEIGGVSRLGLIRELVDTHNLCESKSNFLWGLSNPGELSVYPLLFSGYVNSIITVAFCESAYLYAEYGARFSRTLGVLGYLGSNGKQARLNHEQMRTYYYNVSIVNDFVRGEVPADYVENACAILGEEGV